jgi:hypothetical protein
VVLAVIVVAGEGEVDAAEAAEEAQMRRRSGSL